MKMLCFDTCLDKTYVTLVNGKEFINEVILSNDGNYHSAYLISTIVKLLKSQNLEPTDLDCIATDIGPGSFTGIRACTTVARMLGQQLGIRVVGVSSLEILSRILGGNDLGFSGYPAFNSPTEVGDAIAEAGYNVVLHSSNHSADKGIKGLLNCVE